MDLVRQFVQYFGGIRIEDNVLITATGVEVLSKVPKKIDEIESILLSTALH
jgi:Xaa-Pro aminopeptidase